MQVLTKRADFVRINQIKQAVFTPGFILQILHRGAETAPGVARIGFTASRKVGNAVKRNFAKRRMRALVHNVLEAQAVEAHDYVFIARRAILTRSFEQLQQDLTQATKALHQKYVAR